MSGNGHIPRLCVSQSELQGRGRVFVEFRRRVPTLPVEQRLRLIEEEPRFVTAVAMHYPLSVLKSAVANAVEQFVSVWPAEAWIDPGESFSDPAWAGADFFQVAPFLSLCVANLG